MWVGLVKGLVTDKKCQALLQRRHATSAANAELRSNSVDGSGTPDATTVLYVPRAVSVKGGLASRWLSVKNHVAPGRFVSARSNE